MSQSIRAALEEAATMLASAGVVDAVVDAELLLGHVLGESRGGVQARAIRGSDLEPVAGAAFATMVRRRATREPLQHITGTAFFRSLELAVGPGVFVPRPETETLAQLGIDALRAVASPEPIGIDLGTGSGALALAMATEVPHSRIYAVERSPDAHSWAERNVHGSGADNVTLVRGDLARAFPELDGTVDVVLSNPPYVPDAAVPRDAEVRLHDPAEALYGGEDGLDVVRVLARVARRLLHPGGLLALEHGELQGASVRGILAVEGWRALATHPDLTQRDRVTTAVL